jgi:N-methylhydantoinase B
MLQQVRALPRGSFTASMRVDGYERPIDLVATLTISNDGIRVDYTGTSGPSSRGINVPLAYCEAYTTYGVKCLIAPEVPNNAGTLAAVTVTAPEGSILNAKRPAPVSLRHVIGQMLPDVVFGCLAQATGDQVPAEGTSCLWNLILENHATVQESGANAEFTRFSLLAVQTGGVGARPALDGLSATAFPSGVSGVPIEILESISPLVFFRKELRPDSGGAGRTRGGLGQIIEIESREPVSFDINAAFDRVEFPPRGRAGGKDGEGGYIGLRSGKRFRSKGRQAIPPGERLIVHTPGGGGHGEPTNRGPAQVCEDVAKGLVSAEKAARDYRLGPITDPSYKSEDCPL